MSNAASTASTSSIPIPSSSTTTGSSGPARPAAFVSWDQVLGSRLCRLARFGDTSPQVLVARLVCVDPPCADAGALVNSDDVRGAIALVVRGGCSFATKARRIQAAGGLAMVLANNTRDEPFAMFTMAEDESEALPSLPHPDREPVTIPCVMMCLQDVRELFKQFPPTVKTGTMSLEIAAPSPRTDHQVAVCEQQQQLLQAETAVDTSESGNSGGWGSLLKRTTSSFIKRWDPAPAGATPASTEPTKPSTTSPTSTTMAEASISAQVHGASTPLPSLPLASSSLPSSRSPLPMSTSTSTPAPPSPPLFAFVQWAINAHEYVTWFAPLADFCLAASHAIYDGRVVACDPLLADLDPIRNASELTDAVVLVQRGACPFPSKLERVQRCGATAVIVGNDDVDDPEAAFVMTVDQIRADHITIPAVMVSSRVFARLMPGNAAPSVKTEEQGGESPPSPSPQPPTRVRILCLSGESAEQCLARNGEPTSLLDMDHRLECTATETASISCQAPTPTPTTTTATTMTGHDTLDAGAMTTAGPVADAVRKASASNNRMTQLHAACRGGDHGECQRILTELCVDDTDRRALVSATDALHRTALHHACAAPRGQGNEHVVSFLLGYGAQVTARDLSEQTALHFACLRGHVSCVQRLLLAATTARATSNHHHHNNSSSTAPLSVSAVTMARNLGGATPLHYAALADSTACLELLLSANAQLDAGSQRFAFLGVDSQDVDGETALHIASRRGHLDCVRYLVAANASLQVRNIHDETALHLACSLVNTTEMALPALHIIEKLLDAGAPLESNAALVLQTASSASSASSAPLVSSPIASRGGLATATESSIAPPIQNPALVLDRIQTAPVKRELEVRYLRREAWRAQWRCHMLEVKSVRHTQEVQALTEQLARRKEEARARGRRLTQQQRAIDRLETQMKTMLQLIQGVGVDLNLGVGLDDGHGLGQGAGLDGAAAVVSHDARYERWRDSTSTREASGSSATPPARLNEQERAQEAALARDLGKKWCRQRKFALAETYFERSLALFPLPGVKRLRDEAQMTRIAQEQRQQELVRSEPPPKQGNDRMETIHRLECAVQDAHAPSSTKRSLQREVNKLHALSVTAVSDFDAAVKWIEWLVALPWETKRLAFTSASLKAVDGESQPFAIEAGVFDALERMEQIEREEHTHEARNAAARTIQRGFRERYAVHLLRRGMAAVRLQATIRGFLVRMFMKQLRAGIGIGSDRDSDRQITKQADGPSRRDSLPGQFVAVPVNMGGHANEDLATTVDAHALVKLGETTASAKLVSSAVLASDFPPQFKLVQLLAFRYRPRMARAQATSTSALQSRPPSRARSLRRKGTPLYHPDAGSKTIIDHASRFDNADEWEYFVWSRWGDTQHNSRQCAVCGPYEDVSSAQRRYARLSTTDTSTADDVRRKRQLDSAEGKCTPSPADLSSECMKQGGEQRSTSTIHALVAPAS